MVGERGRNRTYNLLIKSRLVADTLTRALASTNQWFTHRLARTEAFHRGIETARFGAHRTEAYGTLTAHLSCEHTFSSRRRKCQNSWKDWSRKTRFFLVVCHLEREMVQLHRIPSGWLERRRRRQLRICRRFSRVGILTQNTPA